MASLIALLSSGKGTWGQVNSIINSENWDKIILVCNDFAYENFEVKKSNILKLKMSQKKPFEAVKKLSDVFKKEIKDLEVATNLSSGEGVEHMVVVSAILRAGLGLRFVMFDFGELKEFAIFDRKFSDEQDENFY